MQPRHTAMAAHEGSVDAFLQAGNRVAIQADDDALLVARDEDQSGRPIDAIVEDVGSDRIVSDDEFSFCHRILGARPPGDYARLTGAAVRAPFI
jgi:hypothetical protein